MTKKILFFSIFFFSLALAPQVFAQGFTALAPIPGLTDTTGIVNSAGFANFFNNLYKYVIGLAAVFAVIMITWGGLEISTQDSISKQGAGREKITQAIYGLILVLSPVLVFSIINPSILNLSLNLTKIDLDYAPYTYTPTIVDYTLSETETADRPVGTTNVFSFEVNPNFTPTQVAQALNPKQLECTSQTAGTGIILRSSLQTTRKLFTCQTCESGKTFTPYPNGCSSQNLLCGSCN